MPGKDKEKMEKILKIDVMSSEESDSDPSNDAMIVKEERHSRQISKETGDKALEVKSPKPKGSTSCKLHPVCLLAEESSKWCSKLGYIATNLSSVTEQVAVKLTT